jgi:phosphatidylserine decarboxylase
VDGDFLAAFRDEASDHNERTTIVVAQAGRTPVAFTLVAGLVARRIVCRVVEGSEVSAGERVGLIRFGSRVDVDLPGGAAPAVAIGERVVAGETPLARLR